MAPDAVADSVLVDVRTVDSTIQVDARYATANNFTGAPLPGYEAPRALLKVSGHSDIFSAFQANFQTVAAHSYATVQAGTC